MNCPPDTQEPICEVRIVYEFPVDGVWHRGDSYNLSGNLKVPYSVQRAITPEFVRAHQVHYNPKNLEESTLVPKQPMPTGVGRYFVLFVVGMLIVAWGMGLGSYRIQRERAEDTKKEIYIQYYSRLLCAIILGIVSPIMLGYILGPSLPLSFHSAKFPDYQVFFEERHGAERVYHIDGTWYVRGVFPYDEFVETTSLNEVGDEVPITKKTWMYYRRVPKGEEKPPFTSEEALMILQWTPDKGIHQPKPEDDESWRRKAEWVLPEELRPR